jgi:hypothetical protein
MVTAAKLLPTLTLLLSGCSLECSREGQPMDVIALEQAVSRPELGPRDMWKEDRSFEAFLRDALKTQSAAVVAARYGLQCLPRYQPAGCSDCVTCHTTVKQWRFGAAPIPIPVMMLKCVDYGEVLVQAEIGPHSAVKAMTYWKTSPEARKDITLRASEAR